MANLLNAILQANKPNIASPEVMPKASPDQDLGKLFEKTLTSSLDSLTAPESTEVEAESDSQPKLEVTDDSDKIALAMNVVSNPVPFNQPDIKKMESPSTEEAAVPVQKRSNQQPVVQNSVKNQFADSNQMRFVPNLQNSVESKKSIESQKSIEAKSDIPNEKLNQSIIRQMNQSFNQSLQQPVNSSSIPSKMEPAMEWQIKDDGNLETEKSDFVEVKDLFKENDLNPVKTPSSKLSTNDFLSLRGISKNPTKEIPAAVSELSVGLKVNAKSKNSEKKELNDLMSSMAPVHAESKNVPLKLEATVMQTPGQKPVLANESMVQIANHVNLLGKARQDGEIKIKLRPDHLGELQVSVRTVGQNVTVQIKAQSEEAKKMIEDSITSLREHLSSHQLSLTGIDVVTQPASVMNADNPSLSFDSNSGFQQFGGQSGENSSRDGSHSPEQEYYQEPTFVTPKSSVQNRMRTNDSNRLDMIA